MCRSEITEPLVKTNNDLHIIKHFIKAFIDKTKLFVIGNRCRKIKKGKNAFDNIIIVHFATVRGDLYGVIKI
jgi:hypothetical protein